MTNNSAVNDLYDFLVYSKKNLGASDYVRLFKVDSDSTQEMFELKELKNCNNEQLIVKLFLEYDKKRTNKFYEKLFKLYPYINGINYTSYIVGNIEICIYIKPPAKYINFKFNVV